MATTDRRGVSVSATDTPIAGDPNPGLAIKAPVVCATTGANIVLSGVQAIDGITVGNNNERVLVKDQTDQTTNGLYNANSGPWTHTIDANSNDQWTQGTQVLVAEGAVYALTNWHLTAVNPIKLGTSLLTFTVAAAQLPAPTASTLGGVESITSLAHNWIAYIDTSGVPHQSQPAASDITGLAPSATTDTTTVANVAGALRYDAAQSLTSGQREQAQGNIYVAPTTQVFLSGSGTYTRPTGCLWIEVELLGGGGGGGNSGGTGGTAATAGGNTTFGSSLLTANGGGAANQYEQGAGGAASGGALNLTGNSGGAGVALEPHDGGAGGPGAYGGFGGAGSSGGTAGSNAPANSGGGGGGGGAYTLSVNSGGGGGGGAYCFGIITSPSSTYSYAVGAGGTGQATAGTQPYAGGNGGSGLIIVTEHYGS
jgi:hypothetical protein